jgi:hypothetical protein
MVWLVTHDPPHDGDNGPADILEVLARHGNAGRAAGWVCPTTVQQVRDEVSGFMLENIAFFVQLVDSCLKINNCVAAFPVEGLAAYLSDLVNPGVYFEGLDMVGAAVFYNFDATVVQSGDLKIPHSLRKMVLGWMTMLDQDLPLVATSEPVFHVFMGLFIMVGVGGWRSGVGGAGGWGLAGAGVAGVAGAGVLARVGWWGVG